MRNALRFWLYELIMWYAETMGDTTGLHRPAGWGGMTGSGWIFLGTTVRDGRQRRQIARCNARGANHGV